MPNRNYSKFSLSAFLRLTRFWNLFIIGMAQYFAAIFLIDIQLLFDWRLLVLASSTAIVAGGGYIINDYYDIKIDLINKPDRVVIGKGIGRRHALLFHSVLSFAGVALGLFTRLAFRPHSHLLIFYFVVVFQQSQATAFCRKLYGGFAYRIINYAHQCVI